MEQKKTISELYEECKHEQELKQQLEYLRDTTELFKKQSAKDLFGGFIDSIKLSPIPPIPQSFQGKV